MKDRWLLRGPQFGNCNCAYGCPCQFGSPTTNGFCQAFGAVQASTVRETLDTIYTPIEFEVDVDRRTARIHVPDLFDSRGTPILDPHSGEECRAGISLPNGFEYSTPRWAAARRACAHASSSSSRTATGNSSNCT